MITFGAGKLIATPTTDATGAAVANPTPVAVAVLQDVSVDFDFETKTLYGNMQFPVAVGRGKGKVGWKAKSGDFNGALLGSLYFGQTAQPKLLTASTRFFTTSYQAASSPENMQKFSAAQPVEE